MSDASQPATHLGATTSQFREDDPEAEVAYHPLALDVEGTGFLSWLDRRVEQVSSWLNPILIKEARQSLKSRQFIITFFLLLLASTSWTILGVILNAPDVYYVPTGQSLLAGYYFILAIPMMGIVPLAAYRSLAAEIDDDTFEMLVITRLSSMRIVVGKLNSAMLQMMIYFAAIVPCLAFSYLLRGVDLPTIALLLAIVFVSSLVLTSFALMLATIASGRVGQTMILLVLIVVIFLVELFCAILCLDGLLSENWGADAEVIMMTVVCFLISASCAVVFLKAAAARVAPITENRSTGLRWCMFIQQLLWVGSIAGIAMTFKDPDVLNFGTMIVGGYWLLMGMLTLSESPELSPRVQRGLPRTLAGRVFLTWFTPGPGTGYVFALASGTVGAISLGAFGQLLEFNRRPSTETVVFAMLIVGYLWAYLGVIRLISMPLSHRFGRMLPIPISTAIAVLGLAALLPTILSVLTTGSPPYSYTPMEAIDWAWSLVEAFDKGFDPMLAILVLIVGLLVTLLNLAMLFREFEYRRIAIPARVAQDQGK